jgi:hypothetical protein
MTRTSTIATCLLAAALSMPAVLSQPRPAQAQGLFGGVSGVDCAAYSAGGGTFWHGFFRGREESPFLNDDGLYDVTHYRCFPSQSACNAWLYDVQSSYPVTSRTWCRPHQG